MQATYPDSNQQATYPNGNQQATYSNSNQQATYSNSNQELVHIYAATSVCVEAVEEFLDLFAREFHACLLHPFAEFCKIQRLAAIVVDVSEKPEDSSQLYRVLLCLNLII